MKEKEIWPVWPPAWRPSAKAGPSQSTHPQTLSGQREEQKREQEVEHGEEKKDIKQYRPEKLDGVGTIDNRPSTN